MFAHNQSRGGAHAAAVVCSFLLTKRANPSVPLPFAHANWQRKKETSLQWRKLMNKDVKKSLNSRFCFETQPPACMRYFTPCRVTVLVGVCLPTAVAVEGLMFEWETPSQLIVQKRSSLDEQAACAIRSNCPFCNGWNCFVLSVSILMMWSAILWRGQSKMDFELHTRY